MQKLRMLADPAAQQQCYGFAHALPVSPESSSLSSEAEEYCGSSSDDELESRGSERIVFKPHRVAINSKMRVRSKQMRDAFETLRQVVPFDQAEPYLSQCNLIRRATQYIRFMDTLLEKSKQTEI